ncbi:S8 family serine peptidase [Actinoplanes sp. N902-109]|uniref:S8 family serine peptidase n=1 Tax=Actinoplanes sp. (strain N902-109) TaxID=649831 RepID=UPI0003293A10|nr:S8 family serine peptidase [Actinoplanes sp. N902-109]AGL15204.1 peptidase S8/S53 subtilisin kexin sedolisin [Actinoplanes sp. N902-109]
MRRRTTAGAATLALAITLTGLPARAALAAETPAPRVSSALLATLADDGTATFWVYLRDKADLTAASRIADKDDRATRVYTELTSTAEKSQRGLRALLDAEKATYTSYWAADALRVTGDKALLDAIAARTDVERIDPVRTLEVVEPVAKKPAAKKAAAAPEWGLSDIGAPEVWSAFADRGEGIVVANIDTGVDITHPALKAHYRGAQSNGSVDNNYNWFDPTGICGAAPCDNGDHGTHTMGTMVGDDGAGNQIGVAPGAKFIAAKGCETTSCTDASLLAAGQWILAPTDSSGRNPRPELRPDVVNNSWGGGRGDLWYQETVRAWVAAGIFPAFAAGNAQIATCNSATDPGDYPDSYAVGAYDSGHAIGYFSLRGTSSIDGSVKPDVAAPGVDVRSSIPGGGYEAWDGTSMATPHVAGSVALLWSAAPSLRGDIAATRALLDDSATDTSDLSCGGTADDNNVFGEGRLNVHDAVVAAPRGPVARATGTVTDAGTGTALAGVTVTAEGRTVTTGTDGKYQLTLEAGTHGITATKYGYVARTSTVTVAESQVVTVNFALTAAPMVTVSGTVTDGSGHGWPLYAKIEVTGRPGDPVYTDPATGRYSLQVPAGTTYTLKVTAVYPGYQPTTQQVTAGTSATTANLAVPVEPACTAAGYKASYSDPLLTENFDPGTTPAGWSVVNRTDGGGWGFTDIGGRGNLTGGSGGFAIIDSDKLGSGKKQDSDLVTPPLDLRGQNAPVLRFNSDFWALSSPIDIDVSADAGGTWTNVWHQTASRRGPVVEEVPLTPAAGVNGALVRFRYQGSYSWFWQVDNVRVVNRLCTPVPGGLVVGTTTDANTGAALPGVTVTSDDAPADKGVSGADGFFWLFSSGTGAHNFTAAKPTYAALSKSVTVVADGARKTDFALKAGRITVTPTSIESHQTYNTTRTTTVTVTNTGSAPADVEVFERPKGFEALRNPGTAAVSVPMKGLTTAATGASYAATNPKPGTRAADAWTPIANYPTAIYDNAAATVGGKIYSVGGGSSTGNEKKAFVYDPTAATWTALPDLPTGRSKPAAAAVDGKLYVLGGWSADGTPVATVDVYDIAAGTWSTLPGATNPKPRAAAGLGVTGGKIYLIGGCTAGTCTASADTVVFDPATASFSTAAAYPHLVSWTGCGAIGDKVYCGGGANGTTYYKDTQVFDPAANAWTAAADLPKDVFGAQATAAGGLLLLAGGAVDQASALSSQTIGYDPVADAWLTLPAMAQPRYRGAAACGAYRIGGSPEPFVGSADAALLDGLGDCEADGDVPWLTPDPVTFTLAAGKSRTLKVSLAATAAAGVPQPGTYTAQLGLKTGTPYQVPAVSVEMNVTPPTGWGKQQGTVTGTSCAGVVTPLKATIRLNGTTSYTLIADGQGTYAWWLPKGTYQVIVAKDGWIPEVTSVKVSAGFVRTTDFDLEPVVSCAARQQALQRPGIR